MRELVEAVGRIVDAPVSAEIAGIGADLAPQVTVLARISTVIDAEVGRRVVAAERGDVLPHSSGTWLQRTAAWSGSAASRVVTAARFADRHPDVAGLWRCGRISTEVIATLARGLRGQTATVEQQIVDIAAPHLPKLSVPAVRILVAHALDTLHPDDRDAQDQADHDRRSLYATAHGGMTMITADLPGLEGAAVMEALNALAESLRVAGDGLTKAQRRADALITLVNRGAAHGDLPQTTGGLPVGVTVTLCAGEAERIAAGDPHPSPRGEFDRGGEVPVNTDDRPTIPAATGTGVETLGDAATHFALCSGSWTPVLTRDSGPGCLSRALLARPRQPLAVGRSTRLATPAQRIALAVRDRGCLLCGRPAAECQTHHVTEWNEGGSTDLDNLVLLCWSHHRQVDLHRWKIVRNPALDHDDADPDEPIWIVTPTPRRRWRQPSPRRE
ncbi:MAG: DUF222 domain-containing protein [Candidatus Nanopelagicales bacterium]